MNLSTNLSFNQFKMKHISLSDTEKKILEGLKISSKKMIETKIKNNQSIVVMQDGKIVTLTAEDLKKLQ